MDESDSSPAGGAGAEPAPRPAVEDACPLCGWVGTFEDADRHERDAQRCGRCRASLRYRNQAAAILHQLGRGRYANLRDLVKDRALTRAKAVYEPALRGPFIPWFEHFEDYTRSYYWEDVAPGAERDGVRCEDLTRLTFPDARFDLIVTSDVMEHVFHPERAFAEIFRVLRPGGAHVLTVPVSWPMPAETIVRAELIDGEVVHHREPRYHSAGDGSRSLYLTEFGFDTLDLLESLGYDTWFERPSIMRRPGYFDVVLVCRRPRR